MGCCCSEREGEEAELLGLIQNPTQLYEISDDQYQFKVEFVPKEGKGSYKGSLWLDKESLAFTEFREMRKISPLISRNSRNLLLRVIFYSLRTKNTVGHDIENDHTSGTCNNPAPGHQYNARRNNMMGGNPKKCHKYIMPSQAGKQGLTYQLNKS